MKVQDLIEVLQGFDPETEVIFSCDIESGRSSSHVGYCDVSINHEDVYEYELEGEVREDENVVVINVWGEESDWD